MSARMLKRLRNFAVNRRGDARLREEMEAHVAMHAEENVRAGMPAAEARRQARLKFGSAEAVREQYHAEEGLPLLENLAADVRFGWRQMLRNPGFSVTVIVTLALAVGANTAAQRRREIGIRLALGSTVRHAMFETGLSGARASALGLIVGLVLCGGVLRAMRSAIFGVSVYDARAIVAAALMLASVVLIAATVPTLSIANIDPAKILRDE